MIRYFLQTIQGRIIGLFVVFMTLVFALSVYTIRYTSQNAMEKEKETKLLHVAAYQDRLLGEQDYDSILAAAGVSAASPKEKIAVLNRELTKHTDEVASLFPGLGAGYYSIQLDAILTYGPSGVYSDLVGVAIAGDHPGRVVMRENIPLVRKGSMVRGNIMNAMHPLVRGGKVIGYTWANELMSDIEQEYQTFAKRVTVLLTVFYLASLFAAVAISRRLVRDMDVIITGVENMRDNLSARIENVGGELGAVARNINSMAEDIEKNSQEHDALLRAEAANAAQRDFLSRMSHEMRTPMNAVIGMTNIARQTQDTGKARDYLEKIYNAANHLLGVINDVLDMSKIEAGKLELSETSFSPRNMLNQTVSVAGFKIEEKRQRFTMQISDGVPKYITADRQRLAQVITNLLSNANKFTPEGGNISLNVSCPANDNTACRLRFEVRDDGIGIAKEQQDKLFHSFEQVDNSIARKYGGTGLGLAISKRIIELMRGRVWIESELGHGASFIFEIEALVGASDENEAANPPGGELPPQSANAVLTGKHLLLAEDIDINREIVLALLEPTGAQIDCAENGIQALRLFSDAPDKYDLIFMDVQMPEMDGYEATRRIRSLDAANARTIPIIAMTANVFNADIEKCLAAGMNGHVGKPLDFDEIFTQLRKWLP